MARIFTITFEYKGAEHSAVVSTWKEHGHLDCYQVSLFDQGLHHLVPDGIVRFCSNDDAVSQFTTFHSELVHCLKNAVNSYLQKLPI